MKLVYFARIRERIGTGEEEIALPAEVATAGALIDWLAARGPTYAHALERPEAVRIAVDKVHAGREASIAGAREVALFPPMTGG